MFVLKVYNVIGEEVAALVDGRRKQVQSGRYKQPDDQGKMWFGLFSSLGSFCSRVSLFENRCIAPTFMSEFTKSAQIPLWVAASAVYIRVLTQHPGVKKMIPIK